MFLFDVDTECSKGNFLNILSKGPIEVKYFCFQRIYLTLEKFTMFRNIYNK